MRVTFSPIGNTAEAKANETVLDVARRAGAPIGNACGGIGVCNRCRVERDPDLRLACQAVVLGDCTVTTSYW